MDKLDQLEKSLKEYREELEKFLGRTQTSAQGSGSTGGSGPSIASQIGFGKKEEDEDEKKEEKEEKKEVQKEIDKHNEKKHGEAKSKDSAFEKACDLVKFDANGQWKLDKK